jgi:PPM family protein phosphatase
VVFAYFSEKGRRNINQDYVLVDEEKNIAVIGDGMSKLDKGDLASKLGVTAAYNFLHNSPKTVLSELVSKIPNDLLYPYFLYSAGCSANNTVLDYANNNHLEMGSTLDALLILENDAYLCHMGDSLVYHKSGSEVKKITQTHYSRKFIEGEFKQGITCSLGCKHSKPDIHHIRLKDGDTIMMMTDGLFEFIGYDGIYTSISSPDINYELKCLKSRCENKSYDNATLVLYRHSYVK